MRKIVKVEVSSSWTENTVTLLEWSIRTNLMSMMTQDWTGSSEWKHTMIHTLGSYTLIPTVGYYLKWYIYVYNYILRESTWDLSQPFSSLKIFLIIRLFQVPLLYESAILYWWNTSLNLWHCQNLYSSCLWLPSSNSAISAHASQSFWTADKRFHPVFPQMSTVFYGSSKWYNVQGP